MESQQQQQQQQQQYHYQYPQQQSITETPLTTQQQPSFSYDPSQIQQQSYVDQSSYYYQQYPQQQQDYSSYYYQQVQDYSTAYHQHQQTTDPNSIHQPGVPLNVDSNQTHVVNHQNYYYPHAGYASQPTSHQGFYPTGGTQASQPVRGRGTFGRHGRGRGGGGRGKPKTTPAPNKEPSPMAWCEVCRTDCTTFEVLEQHKNGKRHKKNLKVQSELLNLSKQIPVPNPETIPPQNDNITPVSASRGGLKRKLRGGRGGKLMRAFDGSRRPVDPPKPKQVIPYICELCNVKCESQVVFQTHITGKKHIAQMKRFQGHKEVFGEGIQALYPSISNLLPSTSNIISQATQPNGSLGTQALASMMLSQQNVQDPQAAQEALTQILHQHGIHDTQTLMTQLVPYLLTQAQVPGSLPAQVVDPCQGAPVSAVENDKPVIGPV